MMRLISVDIQEGMTMYHFRDQEAVDNFIKERVEPDLNFLEFTKNPLGIAWSGCFNFEKLTEYNGFLTEV